LNTRTGRILIGKNHSSKSHPIMKNFLRNRIFQDHTISHIEEQIHSEIDVLTKAAQSFRMDNFSGYTLWVARFKFDKKQNVPIIMNSKPCIGCQSKMQQFNITNCIHT